MEVIVIYMIRLTGQESEDESAEDSDDDPSSEEDEDKQPTKAAISKASGVKAAPKDETDSDEDSDEGSDDESDDDESKPEVATKPVPSKANGTKSVPKTDSDEDEDEDEESSDEEESGSSEGSDEEEEEEEEPKPAVTTGQKRKDAPAADPETPVKRSKPDSTGSTSIFVGNLSWNIDQEWLARIFESVGGVVGARIITDRDSGRPKGFGYVDFETPEFAQKALELKDTEVDGRPINVDLAQSKPSGDTPRSDRAQRFGDKISEPSATLFVGNMSFKSTQDSLYELFGQAGEVVSVRIPTDKETGQLKGYNLQSLPS